MEQLLIFPFGGNGIEALNCIGDDFEFIGFVDDVKEKQGKNKLGFTVYSREAFTKFPNARVLAVPGNPSSFRIRDKVIAELNIDLERFTNVIHPKANIPAMAKLGFNILIMAGVVLTANCVIENHVCLLPNTVVHHDSFIGEYTLIGSNVTVAGNTKIGKRCYIGSGTSIINGISIGNDVLIGMGSNVIRSVEDGIKMAGNPARKLG